MYSVSTASLLHCAALLVRGSFTLPLCARLTPLVDAKLFTLSPSHLPQLYPRLSDFLALQLKYDPLGKFQNPYLKRLLT